jgi:hypothetical protein
MFTPTKCCRFFTCGSCARRWRRSSGFFYSPTTGRKSGKWLGIIVPLLPVVFIAWMIVVKGGFASPYYAGMNLVLLAVGAVLHWTLSESIVAVTLV